MDYQKIYDNLMKTRKDKVPFKNVYYERHHIIMKSMGGTYAPENLVYLTPREHFLAHWLLWRIHRSRQTALAFFSMQKWARISETRNTSSRRYQEAREAIREKGVSEETKRRMSIAQRDRKFSDETKRKMAISAKLRIRVTKRKLESLVCANCGIDFQKFEDSRQLKERCCGKKCAQNYKIRKISIARNEKFLCDERLILSNFQDLKLTNRRREIVQLFVDGMKKDDIAIKLNIANGTVASTIFHIKKMLL